MDTTATTHKSSSGKGREESKSNCRDQRKSNSSDQKHHPVRTPEEEEGKSGTTTAAIREIIQQQDGHRDFTDGIPNSAMHELNWKSEDKLHTPAPTRLTTQN